MDSRPSSSRIEILDPLRGLAALSVAWFHFTNGGDLLPDGWLKRSGARGWLGVEAFFVISGFVIPYSMHRARYRIRQDWLRFFAKRLARLEPPYLASILLTLALGYASTLAPGFRGAPFRVQPLQLALHVGYLNAYFGYGWINPVYWTLAIEFQFYLLAAISFPLVAHRSAAARLAAVGAICALMALYPRGWSSGALPAGFRNVGLFQYAGLFALGALAFQKFVGLLGARGFVPLAIAVSAPLAAATNISIASVGLATALAIAFLPGRALAPLAPLGTISYSLYLVHVPVGGRAINLGTRFAHGLFGQLATLAAATVVSIAAAIVLGRFVERPAQRLSARVSYAPKPEVGAAPEPAPSPLPPLHADAPSDV